MTVTVTDLSFAYGHNLVLESITATASPGRVTAVLGPNAVGKSTLLRCVIGAARPRSGQARLDGESPSRLRGRALARRVAYVPQRSIVSAALTVREVVELGRYALPRDRPRVESALERFDLLDVADRPYPALSVGQQQRVTLARAVAQVSSDGCLVLDEPTSAMDLRHARACFRVLRELAATGVTVLVALHDLTTAALVTDDVWMLRTGPPGRLAAVGAVDEVMQLERLESVFGVRFEWMQRRDGRRVLGWEG